jgi:4-hydroxy-tetrahydrodipicolinate reductase
MTPSLTLGVGGALGRMGRAVTAIALAREGVALAARFDRPGAAHPPGALAGLPALTSAAEALAACAVIVDFSTGPACAALADQAAELAAKGAAAPALVVGATGLSAAETAVVARAAERLAIVQSGNFSVGVNVLAGLVEQAARRLGPEIWDIEIVETHHRRKIDAPSGTALMFAKAAARGRGRALEDLVLPPRAGITGPRPAGGIGIASLRGGGVVGEHAVVFAAEEETLTLSHVARDRALFARGAVEAALWVAGQPPGLYDMVDVLGFRDHA